MATKPQNPFTADQFTATAFRTAEEKAKFANHFARFVLGGFRSTLFPKWFYQQLSNTFMHIAHCNRGGFWSEWFATPGRQFQFLQRVDQYVPCGQPEHTYSDVERELKSWVTRESTAIVAVLEENELKYAEALARESERRHALLERTHQQFTVVAKSKNTGAFGHRQYILAADDGIVYAVQCIYLYPLEVGQVVHVPLEHGDFNWAAVHCECPERRSCRIGAIRQPGNRGDQKSSITEKDHATSLQTGAGQSDVLPKPDRAVPGVPGRRARRSGQLSLQLADEAGNAGRSPL